ncbi:endonuclease NucS domain-containing protein [Bradyrhizobium australafricanum]|uniref:endonuclease NucS domain-containing protein n=1 Tax=Bradyrhizobium australafricanum TaxID=2821406 RepID=UPI001CE32D91|nr:endonuclease NucS domain-containing protein [Bradyrhizobium australafricanum]MCA6104739.1 DUF91 domain-containing protein [Bradyrhizobium australafricanum]
MTYRSEQFKEYLSPTRKPSTLNVYLSYIGRIDRLIGGLDEALARDGVEKTLAWAAAETRPPFDNFPSQAKSILNSYAQFHVAQQSPDVSPEDDLIADADQTPGSAFGIEREMQAAVRKQLSRIEPGLVEADGGKELGVATGYIDIVARDTNGKLVVIELKAGKCPAGAMEQALGYAQALGDEKNEEVRVLLIASDFPDRIMAASKRTVGLKLLKYEFSLSFTPAD